MVLVVAVYWQPPLGFREARLWRNSAWVPQFARMLKKGWVFPFRFKKRRGDRYHAHIQSKCSHQSRGLSILREQGQELSRTGSGPKHRPTPRCSKPSMMKCVPRARPSIGFKTKEAQLPEVCKEHPLARQSQADPSDTKAFH